MKKKLITIFLTLAAALCLCLGLAACGGGNGGSSGEGGSDPEHGLEQPPETGEHVHAYTVDNVCSVCGDKWEYTEGLQYEPCEGVEGFLDAHEAGYLVKAPDEGELGGDIVIPYGHNGKWVTTIVQGGFCNLPNVKSITIPNSISCIMSNAFMGCTSLTSIVIPDSVTALGGYAFEGCTALKSVKIGSGTEELGREAFCGCTALTEIELSDSGIEIGQCAFENTAYYDDPANWDNSGTLYIGNHLIKAKGAAEGAYTVRAGTKTIAAHAFMNETYPEKEEYIYSMTYLVLPEGLLAIGNGALDGCSALADITIPDSVIRIQEDFESTAYYQDQSRWEDGKVLYLGNHLIKAKDLTGSYTVRTGTKCIADDAFYNCAELSAISLPDSVVSIGESAFQRCSALRSIVIPDGVKELRPRTFDGCSSLENIKLGSGLEAIGWGVFWGCGALKGLTVPAGVTKLGYYIFENCDALETLEVEAGNNLFRSEGNCIIRTDADSVILGGCKKTVIPEGVTRIGAMAFYECSAPESIVIPDSVTEIAAGAFEGCSSLKSIVIPDGVTELEEYTFSGCSSLTSVELPKNLTEIKSHMFSGCSSLAEITIGSEVTKIGKWAFGSCSSLTSVTFQENSKLTSIEDDAFSQCTSLRNFVIPDSVTSLGVGVFGGCSGLKSITIGKGVTVLNPETFLGCDNLESAIFADPVGWVASLLWDYGTGETKDFAFSAEELSDPTAAARYLVQSYFEGNCFWTKNK